VEKYRPATIDDLQQQDQVVSTLKNAIKTGNVGRPLPASVSSFCWLPPALPAIACAFLAFLKQTARVPAARNLSRGLRTYRR